MAIPQRNLNGPAGEDFTHLHVCTLTDYTAAGTTVPVVGDIVEHSTTGNWYVKRAADDLTGRMGEITKIELAPSGSDLGYVVVSWFDALRIVELDCDDATTATLGNAAIKDGNTTVADNFDAGATTGNMKVVAKSGTSGAIKLYAAVYAL